MWLRWFGLSKSKHPKDTTLCQNRMGSSQTPGTIRERLTEKGASDSDVRGTPFWQPRFMYIGFETVWHKLLICDSKIYAPLYPWLVETEAFVNKKNMLFINSYSWNECWNITANIDCWPIRRLQLKYMNNLVIRLKRSSRDVIIL